MGGASFAMQAGWRIISTWRFVGQMERCVGRETKQADVFDYIESFYNPIRRPSTIGHQSPIAFEREAGVA